MEIQVKIDKILEPYRFSKKDGSPCARFSFIGVTLEQYSKTICFDVIGDDAKWQVMGVVVGGVYTVSFDLSSREFNGKWYTGVTAWRVVPSQVQYTQPQSVVQGQGVVYSQPIIQQPQQVLYSQPTQQVASQPYQPPF